MTSEPPKTPQQARALRFTRRRVTAIVVLPLFAILGWSIGGYLTAPGTDTYAARLSGWARDHHLGAIVNELERIQYDLNKPKTGGTPAPIPVVSTSPAPVVPTGPEHLPAPPTVLAQASPALAGEGHWATLVSVKGVPALRAAYIRPDSEHTSYLTGLAWMDQKLLRFDLHPASMSPAAVHGSRRRCSARLTSRDWSRRSTPGSSSTARAGATTPRVASSDRCAMALPRW